MALGRSRMTTVTHTLTETQTALWEDDEGEQTPYRTVLRQELDRDHAAGTMIGVFAHGGQVLATWRVPPARGPGQPRLVPGEETVRIVVCVPASLRVGLLELAASNGRKLSAEAREALTAWVEGGGGGG